MPFGESFVDEHSTTTTMPYKFNGKEQDAETGLYYYGARYYDPGECRFYGVDPFAEKFSHQSPYVYANNNPINLIDYNGESGQEPDSPTQQAQFSQNPLKKFQQVENLRNSVANQILNNQGVPVNYTTTRAAGSCLNITPTFKDAPVIGDKGPIVNAETEPRLVGATIRLSVPEEYTKNDKIAGTLKEIGKTVAGEVAQEGAQKFIEYTFNIAINAKGANVVSMLLNFQEIGGGDLNKAKQEQAQMMKVQAVQAVIEYFLQQQQTQEQNEKDK
jgi:RHS repeat-associated protein